MAVKSKHLMNYFNNVKLWTTDLSNSLIFFNNLNLHLLKHLNNKSERLDAVEAADAAV